MLDSIHVRHDLPSTLSEFLGVWGRRRSRRRSRRLRIDRVLRLIGASPGRGVARASASRTRLAGVASKAAREALASRSGARSLLTPASSSTTGERGARCCRAGGATMPWVGFHVYFFGVARGPHGSKRYIPAVCQSVWQPLRKALGLWPRARVAHGDPSCFPQRNRSPIAR